MRWVLSLLSLSLLVACGRSPPPEPPPVTSNAGDDSRQRIEAGMQAALARFAPPAISGADRRLLRFDHPELFDYTGPDYASGYLEGWLSLRDPYLQAPATEAVHLQQVDALIAAAAAGDAYASGYVAGLEAAMQTLIDLRLQAKSPAQE